MSSEAENLSIPQLMTRYNPDNVRSDKIVHQDAISGKILTYGGLRTDAAKCAWGLQQRLGLNEQDVISVVVVNCV
jgi:acyl-coenzyme A synthetase/AMP-(fatty) acid ligase